MRPGQLTPENPPRSRSGWPDRDCFNEAGAINPGKRFRHRGRDRSGSRFNEAGAINPGKQAMAALAVAPSPSFNEAGAINPGKLLSKKEARWLLGIASMRPGQLTPENRGEA